MSAPSTLWQLCTDNICCKQPISTAAEKCGSRLQSAAIDARCCDGATLSITVALNVTNCGLSAASCCSMSPPCHPLSPCHLDTPPGSSGGPERYYCWNLSSRAGNEGLIRFHKHGEKAFSWLKASTTAFTFKTLLRHYAKQALTHSLSTSATQMS